MHVELRGWWLFRGEKKIAKHIQVCQSLFNVVQTASEKKIRRRYMALVAKQEKSETHNENKAMPFRTLS